MFILMLTEELAEKIDSFFESKRAHSYIIALTIINGLVMGLGFVKSIKEQYGSLLGNIDSIIISIFIIELASRIITTRAKFFKNYWNVFDLLVTTISVLPFQHGLGPLRLLRSLHSLRLLELLPKTKHILDSLAHSMMGILNVILLAFVFYYIFAIIATDLFASIVPGQFGSLEISMLTLFKFMTSPNWEVVHPITDVMPYGWVFFCLFIICISYFVLNLVIGVVVEAMAKAEEENEVPHELSAQEQTLTAIKAQLAQLNHDMVSLRQQLSSKGE